MYTAGARQLRQWQVEAIRQYLAALSFKADIHSLNVPQPWANVWIDTPVKLSEADSTDMPSTVVARGNRDGLSSHDNEQLSKYLHFMSCKGPQSLVRFPPPSARVSGDLWDLIQSHPPAFEHICLNILHCPWMMTLTHPHNPLRPRRWALTSPDDTMGEMRRMYL